MDKVCWWGYRCVCVCARTGSRLAEGWSQPNGDPEFFRETNGQKRAPLPDYAPQMVPVALMVQCRPELPARRCPGL